MSDRTCIEEYPFQSSSGNGSYIVKRYDDGSLSCGCKGFIFSPKRNLDGHRSCRHTDYVHGMIKSEKLQQADSFIATARQNEKTNQQEKRLANFVFNKPQPVQPAKRYFSLEDE
jgi:hypothetical protein